MATIIDAIREKYKLTLPTLNEAGRRRWAAAEAAGLPYGGITWVHRATGLARHTIRAGVAELRGEKSLPPPGRPRQPGSGRRSAVDAQPGLLEHLDSLIEPETRGDPMCSLRWTTKSTDKLSRELAAAGFEASPRAVAKLLKQQDFSLQSTSKRTEGNSRQPYGGLRAKTHNRMVREARVASPCAVRRGVVFV